MWLRQAVRAFESALEKDPKNIELTTKIGKVACRKQSNKCFRAFQEGTASRRLEEASSRYMRLCLLGYNSKRILL